MDTNNKIMSRIEKSPGIPALVASQIIDLIADGRLKPGEKLPSEQEMTQLFGISRISLREAMKLLEAREYIETRGRKGKFIQSMVNTVKTPIEEIISMNHKKIWELLEVRRILDSQAAAIACKNATQKNLERLKKVKDQALYLGPDQILHDIKNGGIIYTSFFDIVAESTGNTIFVHLRKSVNSILSGAFPYSRKKLSTIRGSSRTITEQLCLIQEAIEKKDPDAAIKATIEHIDYIEQSLQQAIAASESRKDDQ